MSQVSEQKKTEGIVEYRELKRPLTKEEKQEIRQDHRLDIDDSNLFDKFVKSLVILLGAGGSALAIGGMGVAQTQMATTAAGTFVGGVLGVTGFGATAYVLGKFGYDAYRYFSDRHRRIHALEQEKIKEIAQRDSQELQRVRESKIAEAQKLQEKFYEGQTSVVAKRKLLNKKKTNKSRQELVALLDSLNKQPASPERKAAKEAAVRRYRTAHSKAEDL